MAAAFKIRALMEALAPGGKVGGGTGGPCAGTIPPCGQTRFPPQPGCIGEITFPGCVITNTPWACTPTHVTGTITVTPVWCTPTHHTTVTLFGAAGEVASLEALSALKEQLTQQLAAVETEEKRVMDTLLPTTVEGCHTLIAQLKEALAEVEAHCQTLSAEKPADPK